MKTWSNPAIEELSINNTFGGVADDFAIDHEAWNDTIAKGQTYNYYGKVLEEVS